jgi:ADP-ribosylglycohydrolase
VPHELIRAALTGADPLTAVPAALAALHPVHRPRYEVVLSADWHPDRATEFNGTVWPCPGSAVWALRTTTSYEEAVRAAIDLGGDTDTVAAVTGAPAGAVCGAAGIPQRRLEPLHVPLPGFDGRILRARDLTGLAERLITRG